MDFDGIVARLFGRPKPKPDTERRSITGPVFMDGRVRMNMVHPDAMYPGTKVRMAKEEGRVCRS